MIEILLIILIVLAVANIFIGFRKKLGTHRFLLKICRNDRREQQTASAVWGINSCQRKRSGFAMTEKEYFNEYWR